MDALDDDAFAMLFFVYVDDTVLFLEQESDLIDAGEEGSSLGGFVACEREADGEKDPDRHEDRHVVPLVSLESVPCISLA